MNKVRENNSSVFMLAASGVMTAVICILAPCSIPIGAVPISLTNLVIYISLYVLGTKRTVISYLTYLLIGLVGMPVFSGFSGGAGKLFGPTGGYLIGFIPMAIIAGKVIDRFTNRWYLCLAGMITGTMVCYGIGTAWLVYQTGMNFVEAMFAGIIPFIPGDLIKMIIAILFGVKFRKHLLGIQAFL